jgi:hypothetical protein
MLNSKSENNLSLCGSLCICNEELSDSFERFGCFDIAQLDFQKMLDCFYYVCSSRSDKTPYAKQNGGRYNFIFDGKGNALPDDQV